MGPMVFLRHKGRQIGIFSCYKYVGVCKV